ncbi:hypothetical protein MMC07_009408, partial [Pseudocyphellaria aurata]|nr:hypothetical protein [Pseudocyphellaria aurata]
MARMIQAMYQLVYSDVKIFSGNEIGDNHSKDRHIEKHHQFLPAIDEVGLEETWVSHTNINVKMYILGDKYGCDAVKAQALQRVVWHVEMANENPTDCIGYFLETEILREIPLAYDGTGDTDRGLRDLLLEYVQDNWVRLSGTEGLLDMFAQTPVFALEMITAYKPTTLYNGECLRCHSRGKWTAVMVRCVCGFMESVLGGNKAPKRFTNNHYPGSGHFTHLDTLRFGDLAPGGLAPRGLALGGWPLA